MGRHTLFPDIDKRIIERILQGHLKPGDQILQSHLAKELGVSTIPLREALRSLEADGLIRFHQGHGAQITPVSIRGVAENTKIAIALESMALIDAFPNQTEACFRAMAEALDRLENVRSSSEGLEYAWDFYQALLAPSGHTRALGLIRSCIIQAVLVYPIYAKVRARIQTDGPNLRTIFEACKNRDLPAALQALEVFNRNACDATVSALEQFMENPMGSTAITR